MAKDVNPEEFFIPEDETVDDKFYPEQGDIVFFVGINLVYRTSDGIEVVGEKDSYVGLVQTLSSYTYRRQYPVVVDKVIAEIIENILKKFNLFF